MAKPRPCLEPGCAYPARPGFRRCRPCDTCLMAPPAAAPITVLEDVRLWAPVRVAAPDACWIADGWNCRGYSLLRARLAVGTPRRSLRRARLIVALRDSLAYHDRSWETRHSCDNPPCCNPGHLLAGTAQQNTDDKISRGRQGKPGRAKLSVEQVADIRARRASGESRAALAAEYAVHPEHVTAIVSRRFWT